MLPTASWPRRILALFVDWFASSAVVLVFVGTDRYFAPAGEQDPRVNLWVLVVFVFEAALLTGLAGGSFGQLVTGVRLVRRDGQAPLSVLGALVRSLLVALVIPPLVFRPDGRGLHDLAVGAQTTSLAELRRAIGSAG